MEWLLFNIVIGFFLAIDLYLLRKQPVLSFKRALVETSCWIFLALVVNALIYFYRGSDDALKFFTAYLIEYSLSIDNLFVFLMIFHFFHVSGEEQHKILFLGIVGAIVMRGLMILFGITLVNVFHPIMYIFGAFLIVASIKLFLAKEQKFDPNKNFLLNLAKKCGANRFALVLIAIETTDLIFALDSIPAVFAITLDPFLVYSSNILAVLGLRSLYFTLRGVMGLFEYLHYGLAAVLFFVGLKMLLQPWVTVPIWASLGVIALCIAASILASYFTRKKKK